MKLQVWSMTQIEAELINVTNYDIITLQEWYDSLNSIFEHLKNLLTNMSFCCLFIIYVWNVDHHNTSYNAHILWSLYTTSTSGKKIFWKREVTEEHLLSHSKYHIVKTFLSDQHFLFCRGFFRHLIISIVEVYHQSNFIAGRNFIASFILSSFFYRQFLRPLCPNPASACRDPSTRDNYFGSVPTPNCGTCRLLTSSVAIQVVSSLRFHPIKWLWR